MFKKSLALISLLTLPSLPQALSQTSLFYLEAQGIAGYSSAERGWIFNSMDEMEAMQKPSLGFDYILRFSRPTGDLAVLAIQTRLAYNAQGENRLELQLYNAYLKFKFRFADLWLGHNRPAMGLSSVFDTHAHLHPTLAMYGYGFDRDWGFGLNRDISRGSWGLSLTTGSGMPLFFKGNYLLSARAALGVLSQENRSLGFTLACGNILETRGNHLLEPDPLPFRTVGTDFTFLWNNFESRLEILAGKRAAAPFVTLFWRLAANFLEEDRLKAEVQPIVFVIGGKTHLQYSLGLTSILTSDLTLRVMYQYGEEMQDHRVVFQLYYYRRVFF